MKEKKQERYDKAYLRMALEWGKLSHCKRKQVGALIVKDRMIISVKKLELDYLLKSIQGDLEANWMILDRANKYFNIIS